MLDFEVNSKCNSNLTFNGTQKSNPFKLYDAENGTYIQVERPQRTPDADEFVPAKRKRTNKTNKQIHTKSNNTFRRKIAIALATLSTIGAVVGQSFNADKEVKAESPNSQAIVEINNNIEKLLPKFEAIEDIEPEETAPNNQEIINEINNTIASDPELNEACDNLLCGLNTFSKQLGEDALPLINSRVEELGDGKVDTIDVLKVLWIESNGRIYDKNGDYLVSYTGEAFGPYQLTNDTVDYINNYYGIEQPLDIMNPYDNLDACILYLRFLADKKGADLEKGSLPTGDNLKDAVFWGYHDGAWARHITQQGEDYLEKYRNLSAVDNYPEVVDYITGKLS